MFKNQVVVLTDNQEFFQRCLLEIPFECRKYLVHPNSLEENLPLLQNSTAILTDLSSINSIYQQIPEINLAKNFYINSDCNFEPFQKYLEKDNQINQLFFNNTKMVPGVYANPEMKFFLQQLECVCRCDEDVLLEGETGVGKTWTAEYIHNHSPRKHKKFLPVNIGSIAENLFESEFFGNIAGAFTGAKNKTGYFAQSNGGNLFIDEVSYFPVNLQPKLLTAIENKKYMPVGSSNTVEFDSRLIYATSENLGQKVKERKFCKELLYRINSITLKIPPLRSHLEDIESLCSGFISKYKKNITSGALKKLYHYDYPGNIRELHNILRRACVFSTGTEILERDIVF